MNLVFVADYAKMGEGPKEMQDFYAAMDTGYISQNVYLYCASAGLVTVARGWVDKEALAKAMRSEPIRRSCSPRRSDIRRSSSP